MPSYVSPEQTAVAALGGSPSQLHGNAVFAALLLGIIAILSAPTPAPAQSLLEDRLAERKSDDDEWRKSRLQREPGSVYLEDFYPGEPIALAVKPDAHAFYTPKLARYLGTLRLGQTVELLALGPDSYRVRGIAQQGQIAGWVKPESLEKLDEDFVANLRKAAERHEKVETLIKENAIALGMTADEVIRSLGDPERKTSRISAEGREDVWDFVTYETVPERVTGYDRFGRLVSEIVYVKKPIGRLTAIFQEGILTSVEQTEGNLEGDIKVVAQPFYVIP